MYIYFKMQERMYRGFCLLGLTLIKMAHSLLVIPPFITEVEGHFEVHFFCREDDNTFAINIVWQDPHENIYIPGSGGNLRISAEGSRLSIFNLTRNDTGIYHCLNSDNHTVFAEGNLTVNAPDPLVPTLKYYNRTIELNQPVILNCSVSAVPRPEFQWILSDTEEPLPESSWNSTTYVDKTTTSTLNYTFEMNDLNEYCRVHIMCIAKNHYSRSEHHFTLFLNSSESCYIALHSPSTTQDDYVPSMRSYINSTIHSHGSSINTVSVNNTRSATPVVGTMLCIVLLLVILAFTLCFCKYIYKKTHPNNPLGKKDLAAVKTCDNPAYQMIQSRSPSDNKPHIYEIVPM